MFVFRVKMGYLCVIYMSQISFLILSFYIFSPRQTTVPPGIATSQVSHVTLSTVAIWKICWAMCDDIGN